MFVSHAKVRIVGFGGRSKKRGPQRRRLAVEEVVRMPCLLPTTITIILGFVAVAGGASMSVIGYVPSHTLYNKSHSSVNSSLITSGLPYKAGFYTLKICSYVGPIIMAMGMFAVIMACVFYCEILDKYAILVPDKKAAIYDKDELYEIIVGEMKKSYAQMLVTAYSKAAERSSNCVEYLPDLNKTLTPKGSSCIILEKQIDIECEGYTPSPPIPNKSYSVIQARIQRLRSEDNWLKTSSLPNIRRCASIKRAYRVGTKMINSRTMSYDYTMDEARLRRKSMMLRSIVHWNSEFSELFSQKNRRFPPVKTLPSDIRQSFDDLSRPGHNSYPLTRLIQRRGTFACGDMRTRRMKFLLLLKASESQEELKDSVSADHDSVVTRIRRNSFIPYNTCDRFISREEKKTILDRGRSSPCDFFTFSRRFGNTIPQPGTRRHSSFPIRRDDKIYTCNHKEQRRHSFGLTGAVKSDLFSTKTVTQRSTINLLGALQKRSFHIPPQNSLYLKVPGFDLRMEGRPLMKGQVNARSGTGLCLIQHGASQSFRKDRHLERRHSFSPILRASKESTLNGGGSQFKLSHIKLNEESSHINKYFVVPFHGYHIEERKRRCYNNALQKSQIPFNASTSKLFEMYASSQTSFKFLPVIMPINVSLTTIKSSTLNVPNSLYSFNMEDKEAGLESACSSTGTCSNLSCYGSYSGEGEQSGSSRTASISSERSIKTIMTVLPLSVDGVTSYGTFRAVNNANDDILEMETTKQKHNFLSKSVKHGLSSENHQSFSCSNVFHDVKNEGKCNVEMFRGDVPIIMKAPATLLPSTIKYANTAIQRSKSTPMITGSLLPQTTFTYARASSPASLP